MRLNCSVSGSLRGAVSPHTQFPCFHSSHGPNPHRLSLAAQTLLFPCCSFTSAFFSAFHRLVCLVQGKHLLLHYFHWLPSVLHYAAMKSSLTIIWSFYIFCLWACCVLYTSIYSSLSLGSKLLLTWKSHRAAPILYSEMWDNLSESAERYNKICMNCRDTHFTAESLGPLNT